MVHPSYAIEQGIIIPICVIFASISIYQLFLAFNLRQVSSKRNIHMVLLLQPLFCLPHESDPWSLQGRVPLWASRLMLDFSLLCGGAVVALVIYSHFQAHYATLQKGVPSYLFYALTGTVSLFFLCLLIADLCVYTLNLVLVRYLGSFGAVQFLGVTMVTDFFGFILIYRLMLDMRSKKDMPHKCESENTFAILLRKIKRFHGFFITALFFAFVYFLFNSLKQATSGNGPTIDGPRTPDAYALPGILPAVLAVWIVFTWWSWIPREVQPKPSMEKTTTTPSQSGSALNSPSPPSRILPRSVDYGPTSLPITETTNTKSSISVSRDHPLNNNAGNNLEIENEEQQLLSSSIISSHGLLPAKNISITPSISMTDMDVVNNPNLNESTVTDLSEDGNNKIKNDCNDHPKIFNPYLSALVPVEESEKNEASEV